MLKYKIIQSQFPLLSFFGHNIVALLAPSGDIISEMEGLATSKYGQIKSIGYWKSDKLKVYEFLSPYLYRADQLQQTLYEGTKEEIMTRWYSAREAKEVINRINLPYPFLGLGENSNSVVSTLIACMGIAELEHPESKWAPSKGKLLLPHSQIDLIKKRNGIYS